MYLVTYPFHTESGHVKWKVCNSHLSNFMNLSGINRGWDYSYIQQMKEHNWDCVTQLSQKPFSSIWVNQNSFWINVGPLACCSNQSRFLCVKRPENDWKRYWLLSTCENSALCGELQPEILMQSRKVQIQWILWWQFRCHAEKILSDDTKIGERYLGTLVTCLPAVSVQREVNVLWKK